MLKISTSLIALLLLLTTASAQTAQTPQPWVRLAPPDTGFAVMVPGKTEEQVSTKEQFTSRLFTFVAQDGSTKRAIYLVGWGQYAPSVKLEPQAELEANRDNFVKALPGMKLLTTNQITLDGRLGLEFTGDSDRASVTSRVYIVGNRVFQLAVMVFKGVDEKANVNKFFDSFAFTTNQ